MLIVKVNLIWTDRQLSPFIASAATRFKGAVLIVAQNVRILKIKDVLLGRSQFGRVKNWLIHHPMREIFHDDHPVTPAQASKTPHTTAIVQSNAVLTSASAKVVENPITEEGNQHQTGETRTKHRAPHSQQHVRAEEVRVRDRLAVYSGESAVQAASDSCEGVVHSYPRYVKLVTMLVMPRWQATTGSVH